MEMIAGWCHTTPQIAFKAVSGYHVYDHAQSAGCLESAWASSGPAARASSPQNFRNYDLPFIQQVAQICKEYGVYSHLHVCGRSRQVVEMVAEETEVDVMETLEEPPGGMWISPP